MNGQFEEILSTVNFCKKLVNMSPAGMCCETTGRLRVGVQMTAEIRFDGIGGSLRSAAKIVWVDTLNQGGMEVYRAGLQFVGSIEMTKPVREYFSGRSAVSIVSTRKAEYEELKAKSTARKQGLGSRKAAVAKRTGVTLLILLIAYLGSFGWFVHRGRIESPKPGIHYRYAPPGSTHEETLAKIYTPLQRLFRAAGVDLNYEDPTHQEKP